MFSEQTIVVFFTLLLTVFNVVDWYTTRTILKAGGNEANPIARFWIKHSSVDIYLAAKTALAAYVGYHLGFVLLPMLIFMVALYGFFMARNLRNL